MKHLRQHYRLVLLLFASVIVVVLASIGLSRYRQHVIEQRIENTATEIDNLLTAALNYYAEHEHWPAPHQLEPGCWSMVPAEDNFVRFYSPLHQLPNSVGHYYCYGSTDSTNRTFWVGVHLTAAQANTLGLRLIAELPHAYLTRDPSNPAHPPCNQTQCFVSSEIVVLHPARSSTQVVGIGVCHPNIASAFYTKQHCQWLGPQNHEPSTTVYAVPFDCPALTTKKLKASIDNLAHRFSLHTDCRIAAGCLLKITGTQNPIKASYLAYCEPISADER